MENLTNNLSENNFIGMSILPTFECNLKCLHCFYESGPNKHFVALDEKYIPLIIDFVNENNIENITIGGGEPLIWRHLRKFLEEVLEKTNARIFLLTNGLMINLIEDLLRSSRFNVQISVDAARRETYKRIRGGDFEKLMKNIVKLKEIGVDVALSYTIHSYNKAEVVDFIKKAELVEVNSIHFPIIERYGRAKSNDIIPDSKKLTDLYQFLIYYSFHYNKIKIYFVEEIKLRLLRRITRHNCSALYNQLSLASDGYFYPCSELINDRFKICHISEYKNLKEIIKKFKTRTGIGTPVVEKICPECPIKLLCGGGCRAVELLSGKSFVEAKAESLVCDIFIKSVFTILWELANYELNPPVPIDLLYSKEVLRLVEKYEKQS
ncbi:MAG: hypothetical protein PWP54_1091 [Thermosipho sp. (in: thermotogales)]|nr:hypothetical protein [Thermosipho sp. (in: thermotogales)]